MGDVTERIYTLWLQLKKRYTWSCVDDDASFVATIRQQQQTNKRSDEEIKRAIYQEYGVVLYTTIVAGLANQPQQYTDKRNRAYEELEIHIHQQIHKYQLSPEDRQDSVQNILMKLIAHPADVQFPETLLLIHGWVWWQIRGQVTRVWRQQGRETPFPEEPTHDETTPVQIDPALVSYDQVGMVSLGELLPTAQTILSAIQVEILRLTIEEMLKPLEIAEQLHIPVTRVRVEKARAMSKLRTDPAVRHLFDMDQGNETEA